MRKKKRIRKLVLTCVLVLIIIFCIDLWSARISSANDIANALRVTMYDKDNQPFYTMHNSHESSWIPLEEIPNEIQTFFIEIEDRRFYHHNGFDTPRIFQAFWDNLFSSNKIGGSTITQQYVKNLYLTNRKTYIRKAKELYYAVQLEQIYSKKEILEGYLNTLYFSHGIYGIKDASYFFFSKSLDELSIGEIASLVAVIKAPTKYSPLTSLIENRNRQKTILSTLLKRKKITQAQYDIASTSDLTIIGQPKFFYSDSALYYKDFVLAELSLLKIKSRNHLHIYTSYDSKLNETIAANTDQDVNASAVVINKDGSVSSLYSNTKYQKGNLNITTHGVRMVGSTVKPLLYYEALEHNMTATSLFHSSKDPIYVGKEAFYFRNATNKYPNSRVTMAYAIATSDNIYAVKTHLHLGSDVLAKRLKSFSFTNVENYPALALGTATTNLLNLTNTYHTLSTLGYYTEPFAISLIKDENKTLYKVIYNSYKMLSSTSCFLLNEMLTGTFDTHMSDINSVTGASISSRMNHRAAGKSGSTDFDNYFIGFNPLYTIGVWSGITDESVKHEATKKLPKELFLQIFNLLNEEDIWYHEPDECYKAFIDPTGLDSGYKKYIYFKQ